MKKKILNTAIFLIVMGSIVACIVVFRPIKLNTVLDFSESETITITFTTFDTMDSKKDTETFTFVNDNKLGKSQIQDMVELMGSYSYHKGIAYYKDDLTITAPETQLRYTEITIKDNKNNSMEIGVYNGSNAIIKNKFNCQIGLAGDSRVLEFEGDLRKICERKW